MASYQPGLIEQILQDWGLFCAADSAFDGSILVNAAIVLRGWFYNCRGAASFCAAILPRGKSFRAAILP